MTQGVSAELQGMTWRDRVWIWWKILPLAFRLDRVSEAEWRGVMAEFDRRITRIVGGQR